MRFEQNKQGRDFIIGDLHGHLDLLNERLEEVGFDKSKDRLFSTGDLIDRGPQSLECLKLVLEPWFFAVRGNHEQMMFDSLITRNPRWWDTWMYNGGDWIDSCDIGEVTALAVEVEKRMPLWMEVETEQRVIGIVHAEPPEDWIDIEEESVNHLVWSRNKINRVDKSEVESISVVYCGHTPLREVVQLGNVRYIDTGAFHTGILTIEELK